MEEACTTIYYQFAIDPRVTEIGMLACFCVFHISSRFVHIVLRNVYSLLFNSVEKIGRRKSIIFQGIYKQIATQSTNAPEYLLNDYLVQGGRHPLFIP
jgi:hypothetical protein